MDTLNTSPPRVDPPVGQAAAVGGSPRRARWVSAAAAILAMAVVIGSAVFVSRYRPLEPGSVGLGAEPTASALTSAGGHEKSRVVFRNGRLITFGFSLANRGRFGLTVTGIYSSPLPSGEPLRIVRVFVAKRSGVVGGIRDLSQFDAFHSFALQGGQERLILVQARMMNCREIGAGESSTLEATPVSYRFLGLTHRQWVTLPIYVAVVGVAHPCSSSTAGT